MSKSICEVCGKYRKTHKAIIEGAEVEVCSFCHQEDRSIYNKTTEKKESKKIHTIVEEEIVEGYNEEIRKAMRKYNLNEEELAKKLNISLSYLKHIILGKIKPDKKTAKSIEKLLNIKILEKEVNIIEAKDEEKKRNNKLFYTLEENVELEYKG